MFTAQSEARSYHLELLQMQYGKNNPVVARIQRLMNYDKNAKRLLSTEPFLWNGQGGYCHKMA